MAHPFGIVGLIINMVGSLVLLWFPPTVEEYTPDGFKISGSLSELPESDAQRHEWQRNFRARKRAFRGAMALLLIGFTLQLLDLFCT
jgi:hypothetical protein